ncbi:MAG: hypothetical protein KGL25_01330 [Gammaproteobacteria bacterium]|nr:hypothetical protein [Gammaproteobacteria bacterium]
MSKPFTPPLFDEFPRWLAQREAHAATALSHDRYQALLAAARLARDETLRAREEQAISCANHPGGRLQVLQLLAAATTWDPGSRPPELVTARGFRVSLAYDEGSDAIASSICVLVRCPPELIQRVIGQTAFLWNGSERFELGQFDAEGKAIGTLPAGVEIAVSDFRQGRVKLEEPPDNG